MSGVVRARQRAAREVADFLRIGPVQVAELELGAGDAPGATLRPGPGSPPVTSGEVFVLVRRAGRPVGTFVGRVPEGADPVEVLAGAARGVGASSAGVSSVGVSSTEVSSAGGVPGGGGPGADSSPGARGEGLVPPSVSVVVATRERAGQLARALDSLLVQDHPDFEIVVVDNAPVTTGTRDLIGRKYGERVRYVLEPVPGLAAAHNRGLAVVRGDTVAFTDDDVIADPRWLTELTTPFAADPGLGCVTGLILPARLRTPAQVLLESHGGFAKGFTPRTYDPGDPPADEPLFPFTAGRFGSGANMAFRTAVLRTVGGFDPATGAGTHARGGDDLYGFVRVLAQGHRLHYTPLALVWHHHRETWRDLETQAYGYGAGLTAYLTATLVNRPALLPAFLARLPRGLAHARALTAVRGAGARGSEVASGRAPGGGSGEGSGGVVAGVPGGVTVGVPGGHDARTHAWPRRLSRLQRRGMLYGPIGYLRARHALRTSGSGLEAR
ncbi:glycosyltransferase [Streptomyces sp. NPDC005876]|uniref:glycosyltransferase n=1 Tax=Streptomyces sp. NPDC005876 TaxID=3157076 RepID=UPI0033F34E4C